MISPELFRSLKDGDMVKIVNQWHPKFADTDSYYDRWLGSLLEVQKIEGTTDPYLVTYEAASEIYFYPEDIEEVFPNISDYEDISSDDTAIEYTISLDALAEFIK